MGKERKGEVGGRLREREVDKGFTDGRARVNQAEGREEENG